MSERCPKCGRFMTLTSEGSNEWTCLICDAKWFASRPVRLVSGEWAWLRYVYRFVQLHHFGGDYYYVAKMDASALQHGVYCKDGRVRYDYSRSQEIQSLRRTRYADDRVNRASAHTPSCTAD